jgi:hypothetical protein
LTLLVPPGEIKVKWHRDLPVETRLGAVVLQRSCGKWYVCFHVGTPVSWDRLGSGRRSANPVSGTLTGGRNRGRSIATSDGETVPAPKCPPGSNVVGSMLSTNFPEMRLLRTGDSQVSAGRKPNPRADRSHSRLLRARPR